jgi:hypothetical protein
MNDRDIERMMLHVLSQREGAATACPSDVARALDPVRFRDLMDDVRRVAADLVDRGAIEVLQKGRVIDVRTARGPIRLRLKRDA